MAKMTIMKGLPASGKSTKAKELLAVGNTVRINKDLLREMLHFNNFTHRNEGHTRDAARKLADWFLSNGVNVIIDDTNLNEGTVQSWKDLAKIHDAKIEYEVSDTSPDECIRRDEIRGSQMKNERSVGDHVIKKMALQHLEYMRGKPVIICDLDGTIADCEHRKHFVRDEKKDWKSFFEAMGEDTLRQDVFEKLAQSRKEFDAEVIFVSARPEDYREKTLAWMYDNVPFHNPFVIMRDANDKRPDTQVKSDIYDKYLKHLDIKMVYDDRPSVIRMWKQKGLNVVDVGNGIEF